VVDTYRIDDAFWFFDYTREAADEFASIAENTNALYLPRAVESWGEEIPDSVGRPRWRVWREAGMAEKGWGSMSRRN
jgi:hypothetical protein